VKWLERYLACRRQLDRCAVMCSVEFHACWPRRDFASRLVGRTRARELFGRFTVMRGIDVLRIRMLELF
jgi:hypothetical protein